MLQSVVKMKGIAVLILISILNRATAFYTRQSPDGSKTTHETITQRGTIQALSSYIWENKLKRTGSEISAVNDFFKNDATSKIEMEKSINAIVQAIANTQVEKKDVAYVHCHADQISLAHQHVISCRDKLSQLKNDVVELRKQLGECLYTVQSFYSNTNWIEMYGAVPYKDFGIKGKILMAVASPDEDTCYDVTNIGFDCGQNIKVKNKLTSGYHHGRGNTKPTKPQGATAGKCSHGGPDDESRKTVAKCGINKETPTELFSPHFYLHQHAYLAAIAATKDFLIMKDTGILKLLGSKTFDEIFNIKNISRKDLSLAFVIDVSGSMKEDIAAVRETIIQYVTATIGSGNEPADYVLSLFSDPVTLNKAFVERDGYEMIKRIKNITVAGGYDCPEFAMDGILKAIKLSRNGSTLLVFSDADAKDANRQQEVADAAKTKSIMITPLVTGNCSRGRRSIQYIKRKDTASFFQRLAQATGGKVYRTTKEEIYVVLNDIIEKTFPVGGVIVDSFNWSRTSSNKITVAVDSSITVLKIAVCCPGADSGVDLFYPNGTRETFGSRLSRKLVTNRNEVIISLQRPNPGRYSLQRKSSSNWSGSVNITAQSPVKQETEILENTETDALPTLKGNPIAGKNYTFYVNIYNLGENGTCNDLILTDMLGNELFNVHTIQTTNVMTVRCAAIFSTPNQFFQLKLNGTDKNGLKFTRKNAQVFKPSNFKFRIISPESAVIGKEMFVYYEVENTGLINETYEVAITNDYTAAVLPKRKLHTVFAGDISNGSFTLKPTSSSVILKFSITVYMGKTSEITQRISKTVLMTDIERPVCTIVSMNGTCSHFSLNTAHCNKYHWFVDAEITFEGTELENVTSSVGSATELLFDDISGLRHGPVNISIRGSCCTPSVILAAVDTDGYIALCRIELLGGEIVSPMESYEIDVSVKDKDKTDVSYTKIVIAVLVCAIIVVVVVSILGFINYRTLKQYSRHNINYNVSQNTKGGIIRNQPKSIVEYHLVKSAEISDEKDNM